MDTTKAMPCGGYNALVSIISARENIVEIEAFLKGHPSFQKVITSGENLCYRFGNRSDQSEFVNLFGM